MSTLKKPRCFHVYAMAPESTPPSKANRLFNEFVGDRSLPLVLFHDHFIGKPGGIAIFYIESAEQHEALQNTTHLAGWDAISVRSSFPIAHRHSMNRSTIHYAPRELLYVGDSIVDAELTRNAGVPFAAVLTGATSRETFEPFGPVSILNSVAQLV